MDLNCRKNSLYGWFGKIESSLKKDRLKIEEKMEDLKMNLVMNDFRQAARAWFLDQTVDKRIHWNTCYKESKEFLWKKYAKRASELDSNEKRIKYSDPGLAQFFADLVNKEEWKEIGHAQGIYWMNHIQRIRSEAVMNRELCKAHPYLCWEEFLQIMCLEQLNYLIMTREKYQDVGKNVDDVLACLLHRFLTREDCLEYIRFKIEESQYSQKDMEQFREIYNQAERLLLGVKKTESSSDSSNQSSAQKSSL